MVLELSAEAAGARRGPAAARRHAVALFYTAATVLVAVYGVTLFFGLTGRIWSLIDNQMVDGFEIAVALGCLARGWRRQPGRGVALALGFGLLAWALGDVTWTLESSPSSPSLADGFYLAFYPLAYLAAMLLLRSHVSGLQKSAWVDGAIAGLGAAAICTAFAFDTILGAIGGSPASVAVNLAYPIGDLILLALAVGTLVMVPGRPGRLMLLAAGCSVMAVGDTIYLFQSSLGTYRVGTPLDLTWPAAMLAMSGSVWLTSRRSTRPERAERAPRFVIAGVASAPCLIILTLGNVWHVSTVALGLSAATLVAAAVRVAMSLRELSGLTEARRHQAITDELTGLANRRQLLHELERGFANLAGTGGSDGHLALLLIDLDRFKEVNDSFGHQTGDALLRQIGPRLRRVVRAGDLVARLGGDEFALILLGADADRATAVAQRITDSLREPIALDAASLHVGASIGIAVAPIHAATSAELMRCADIAMYRAKSTQSGFDTYEASLDDNADRSTLIEDLRAAMSDGTLTLHYQPEIDLRTGEVTTVEALLRWPHPTFGLIPPTHLLNLAEESGLLRDLTTWVFERAVSDCNQWWLQGYQVAVSVNVLATDLLDSALPRRLAGLLARAGLPPQALVLEITEAMVMGDLTRAKRVIADLADYGVLVSIDDFGTGFSSLAYLHDLAVGELKLDRMFTSRLQADGTRGRDEQIFQSVVDLGHAMNLRVVAEGIERVEFVAILRDLGCDRGQGFAIQAPCPPSGLDFAALGAMQITAAGSRTQ